MSKKYVLVEVIEREISEPMIFDTEEAAVNKMAELFAEVNDIDGTIPDEIKEWVSEEYGDDGYDAAFLSDYAYCEKRGQNYDWKIFEMSL